MMLHFVASKASQAVWAFLPHKTATATELLFKINFKRLVLKVCQPKSWWLKAWWACTVQTVFIKKTPCLTHPCKLKFWAWSIRQSFFNSLKILSKDGGVLNGLFWQLNAIPSAWLKLWYGSWPITITLILAGIVNFNNLKISWVSGKHWCWEYANATACCNLAK